jgi:hypothetical protein
MCFAADGRPRPATFYGRLGVALAFAMWAAHIGIRATRNYLEALAEATRNHDDDLFAHQLCSDPTIKAGLGRYDLCDRARVNVQLSPAWQATWSFGDQILHCGDGLSCLEWFAGGIRSLTESLNGLILTVCGLVALVVAVVYTWGRYNDRRREELRRRRNNTGRLPEFQQRLENDGEPKKRR